MARKKKKTVDYFPHSCSHGKTLFILDQKHGNDGYSFWFKLLEFLGNTPGHYLNFQHENESNWEFLQAKTHLDNSKCEEILSLLAKLGAIDSELWISRIVWSQNFVDGISDVYKNRRVEIPVKPNFYNGKLSDIDISTDENPVEPEPDVVSTSKSTQTKLKETILKKTNEDNITSNKPNNNSDTSEDNQSDEFRSSIDKRLKKKQQFIRDKLKNKTFKPIEEGQEPRVITNKELDRLFEKKQIDIILKYYFYTVFKKNGVKYFASYFTSAIENKFTIPDHLEDEIKLKIKRIADKP